jgi:site-specific DNA-methyltransferase (adenine-specific)
MNLLINDDSLDYIKKIPSSSIDLILTDPPYLISKKSGFKVGGNKKFVAMTNDFGDWDREEVNLDFMFSEFYRILKKGGTLIVFYDIWKSSEIKNLAMKYCFKQPRICQWVKNNPTPINSNRNYLSNSTEYFFTFVKGKKPTFNSTYDKGIYNYPICHGRERIGHPTQKPLGLFREIIEKHSNIGDLILDPFAGSFTTAKACQDVDRNYICIEKDDKYFELGRVRLGYIMN